MLVVKGPSGVHCAYHPSSPLYMPKNGEYPSSYASSENSLDVPKTLYRERLFNRLASLTSIIEMSSLEVMAVRHWRLQYGMPGPKSAISSLQCEAAHLL